MKKSKCCGDESVDVRVVLGSKKKYKKPTVLIIVSSDDDGSFYGATFLIPVTAGIYKSLKAALAGDLD